MQLSTLSRAHPPAKSARALLAQWLIRPAMGNVWLEGPDEAIYVRRDLFVPLRDPKFIPGDYENDELIAPRWAPSPMPITRFIDGAFVLWQDWIRKPVNNLVSSARLCSKGDSANTFAN